MIDRPRKILSFLPFSLCDPYSPDHLLTFYYVLGICKHAVVLSQLSLVIIGERILNDFFQ
jgi:hypothetical protein